MVESKEKQRVANLKRIYLETYYLFFESIALAAESIEHENCSLFYSICNIIKNILEEPDYSVNFTSITIRLKKCNHIIECELLENLIMDLEIWSKKY